MVESPHPSQASEGKRRSELPELTKRWVVSTGEGHLAAALTLVMECSLC